MSGTKEKTELPKLWTTRTIKKDGWYKDEPCEYSWDELDEAFPSCEKSLVSQLAQHLRDTINVCDRLADRITELEGQLQVNTLECEHRAAVFKARGDRIVELEASLNQCNIIITQNNQLREAIAIVQQARCQCSEPLVGYRCVKCRVAQVLGF
jgi:hypothetical protein